MRYDGGGHRRPDGYNWGCGCRGCSGLNKCCGCKGHNEFRGETGVDWVGCHWETRFTARRGRVSPEVAGDATDREAGSIGYLWVFPLGRASRRRHETGRSVDEPDKRVGSWSSVSRVTRYSSSKPFPAPLFGSCRPQCSLCSDQHCMGGKGIVATKKCCLHRE
jgi:hypothetical protein